MWFHQNVGGHSQWLERVGIHSSGAAAPRRSPARSAPARWPLRRDIAWYRIYGVDVIPGTWTLEVELNPGERVSLPCVDRVDDLYERVEAARSQLGS